MYEELLHLLIRPHFPSQSPETVFLPFFTTTHFTFSWQPQRFHHFLSPIHQPPWILVFLSTIHLHLILFIYFFTAGRSSGSVYVHFPSLTTVIFYSHSHGHIDRACAALYGFIIFFFSSLVCAHWLLARSPPSLIVSFHITPLPLPTTLFSTDWWLIQSQAMLFMKRHFIFQNHLCLGGHRVHHVLSISAM